MHGNEGILRSQRVGTKKEFGNVVDDIRSTDSVVSVIKRVQVASVPDVPQGKRDK